MINLKPSHYASLVALAIIILFVLGLPLNRLGLLLGMLAVLFVFGLSIAVSISYTDDRAKGLADEVKALDKRLSKAEHSLKFYAQQYQQQKRKEESSAKN